MRWDAPALAQQPTVLDSTSSWLKDQWKLIVYVTSLATKTRARRDAAVLQLQPVLHTIPARRSLFVHNKTGIAIAVHAEQPRIMRHKELWSKVKRAGAQLSVSVTDVPQRMRVLVRIHADLVAADAYSLTSTLDHLSGIYAANYGLLEVKDGKAETMKNYDILSSRVARTTPSSTSASDYEPTNSPTQCPGLCSNWRVSHEDMPPTPDRDLCECNYTLMQKWVYGRFIDPYTRGNCQNFVRIVADRICREHPLAPYSPQRRRQKSDSRNSEYHASNWNWFMYDVYGPSQQAQYDRRRSDFWRHSNSPVNAIHLRSLLEAGNEIVRFMATMKQRIPRICHDPF